MIKHKAIKKEVFYDKHFTTIQYEYRKHTYDVTYPNGINVCCTPAYIQHRDAQEKIDKLIDNPVNKPDHEIIPVLDQLDEIWDLWETL